jgi:hypothetical protein
MKTKKKVLFKTGEQTVFLNKVIKNSTLSPKKIAHLCNVHPRTFFDWKREKYNMQHQAFLTLAKQFKIDAPKPQKILDQYWDMASRGHKGGKSFIKKYGSIGSQKSKIKGGQVSQRNRRSNPEKYPQCINSIKKPAKSLKLSEVIGATLGDGHLNHYQMYIYLFREQKMYSSYLAKTFKELFGIKPTITFPTCKGKTSVISISISSIKLTQYFEEIGLEKGNKVKNQVDVPVWIKENLKYSKECLRGLIDTDGGVFEHKHGKYINFGLCFSNHSIPLRNFVKCTLHKLGFTPKCSGHGIYLYRQKEVLRYFEEVGSSNQYHIPRLQKILKKRRDARAVESARLERE